MHTHNSKEVLSITNPKSACKHGAHLRVKTAVKAGGAFTTPGTLITGSGTTSSSSSFSGGDF